MSEIAPTNTEPTETEENNVPETPENLNIVRAQDTPDTPESSEIPADEDISDLIDDVEDEQVQAASPQTSESQPSTSDETSSDSKATSSDASETSQTSQTDASASPPKDEPPSVQTILQQMGLLPAGMTDPAAQSQEQQGQQIPQVPQEQPQVQPQVPPIGQQPVQQQLPGMPPVSSQQPEVPTPQQQPQLDFEAVRNQQIEELATKQYNFDAETVEALTAEGSEQMATLAPRLAARVLMDSVLATTSQLRQVLPTMIDQHFQTVERSKKYEEAFYTFWDSRGFDLREHDADLQSLGKAFTQVNPQGTPDDFITQVGAQVILAKQLRPIGQEAFQTNSQETAPIPFQSASATPGVSSGAPQLNPMEQFLEDVISEDADYDN